MIVSKDTLILSIPFFFKSFANFLSKLQFVVRVISFKLVEIYSNNVKKDDPKEIIIDEFLGIYFIKQ